MNCNICGGPTKVVHGKVVENTKRYRRRECKECGNRFTTYEVIFNDLVDELDTQLGEQSALVFQEDVYSVLSKKMPEKEQRSRLR